MGRQPGGVHPPYLRDRFKTDVAFRSQVTYAVTHAIPFSIYLGRVVGEDEPYWLPEDRDIVAVWDEFERSRCPYGHWQWQWDDLKEFDLDFEVCPVCQALGETQEQVASTRKNMHGVAFSFYPPKEE